MRGRLLSVALALSALVPLTAVPAAPAAPREQASKAPSITRVTPMRVRVGATLTIRGENFSRVAARNTVIFSGSGRFVFAKPHRTGSGKLVLTVPGTVEQLLAEDSGGRKATRVKLRVLAGRMSRHTPERLSPVIVPGDYAGGVGAGSPGAP